MGDVEAGATFGILAQLHIATKSTPSFSKAGLFYGFHFSCIVCSYPLILEFLYLSILILHFPPIVKIDVHSQISLTCQIFDWETSPVWGLKQGPEMMKEASLYLFSFDTISEVELTREGWQNWTWYPKVRH